MTILLETSDLPSTSNTNTLIKAGDTFYGSIAASGDRDWIAVDLVAGQTYSFAAIGTGVTPLSDVFLRLLGPTVGRVEAENDDGLPNWNAIITDTPSETGRYYLEVSGMRSLVGDYGLTMDQGTRPDLEVPMIAGVLLDSENTWSSPTLSYGFRVSGNDGATVFRSSFSAAQQNSIAMIMAYYTEVTNLSFTNQGNTNAASILFANYRDNNGIAAYAYGPGSTNGNNVSGDVWYNAFYNTTDFDIGSGFYETMLHEIGHAMGLSHPGLYDANIDTSITYTNSAQFTQDSESLTVMSYFASSETGGTDLTAQTLGIADILALQNAYGANMSTRGGDTTYGYGGTGIYSFTSDTKLTIWDGGGADTLNLSGETVAQRINLNEGTLSDVLGNIGNLGIAIGAMIENALGGSGADTIFGNALDNELRGGGGVDRLFGGAGADTLYGDAGADILLGGAGDDVFFVDNVNDKVVESIGGGYDIVRSTVTYTLGAGIAVQELRAEGTGAINLTGNGSANRLVAGTGGNSLTGGGGRDVFVFDFGSSTTASRDIVTDFSTGTDRFDLSSIDANNVTIGDQTFASLGTNPAANSLWWLAAGTDLILRGDVDGNLVADFEVLLKNLTGLSTADIIL
jgi:serralysin